MHQQSYTQKEKAAQPQADIELFFSHRKSFGEKDDNTPWLITLADLLTILLVFAFVMVGMSGPTPAGPQTVQAKKNTMASLVSVAEATVNSRPPLLAIPLSMYKAAPPKATKHDDEKILMKNSFYIRDAAADLNDAQKTELHQIARMCSVNPSTKIIVAADIDALHNQAVQYAKNIIAYLTLHCGIDKRNVFLQQASDLDGVPAGSGFNSSPTTVQRIEVKLLKDFWSL